MAILTNVCPLGQALRRGERARSQNSLDQSQTHGTLASHFVFLGPSSVSKIFFLRGVVVCTRPTDAITQVECEGSPLACAGHKGPIFHREIARGDRLGAKAVEEGDF